MEGPLGTTWLSTRPQGGELTLLFVISGARVCIQTRSFVLAACATGHFRRFTFRLEGSLDISVVGNAVFLCRGGGWGWGGLP